MRRYMTALLLVISLGIPALSNGAGPSFPREKREIRDPSGLYAVTWKRGEDAGGKPHRLFLKNLGTGRLSKLLDFYRQADVLWAPNGRFVAVTDWTGSNVSQILLFSPGRKKVVDLADELDRSLGILPEISGNDHVYFEALSWDGSQKLLFKVFGHGEHDRNGFERTFEYNVSGVVREAKCRNRGCSTYNPDGSLPDL